MTEHDDREIRNLLGVLDRKAEPDPLFAQSLHDTLVGGEPRPDGRRWSRFTAPAIAAALVIAGLIGIFAGRDDGQRTVTSPDPTVPATDSVSTTDPGPSTVPSTSATTEPDRNTGQAGTGPTSSTIRGFLPDGTGYTIMAEPGLRSEVAGISGGVVLSDDVSGTRGAIGIMAFERTDADTGLVVTDRQVLASSGGWTMRIDLYPEMVATLTNIDPDLERLLSAAITPQPGGSLPRFELSTPLRWADDRDLPLAMEVLYEDVAVRRDCTELAVACSQRQGVQVIPIDRVMTPAPAWDDDRRIWIESDAPRSPANAHWLDPGPLSQRGGHQVLWTGSEMIVWGGARTGESAPILIDGAAFNPTTDTWRLLPPPPFEQPTPTVALWGDGQMLVISSTATVGYDPATNTWQRLGDGTAVGRPVWTGTTAAMVNTTGVVLFDRAAGRWVKLPGADTPEAAGTPTDPWWGGALLALDGGLYLRQGCETDISRWNGTEWEGLPPVPRAITSTSDYQFCPAATQWAVVSGHLLMWEDQELPTVRFDPDTNTWSEISRIPVAGTEGPFGGFPLGDRLLAIGNGAAIFDPTADTWLPVMVPSAPATPDMVWTGSEVLMWGAACCYGAGDVPLTIDAWRWTPPAPADG